MIRCLLLLPWVTALLAAGHEPSISATIPWGNDRGYVPVVVRMHSPVERVITVTVTANGQEARQAQKLEAGDTRECTLLLPAIENHSTSARMEWSTSDALSGTGYVVWAHGPRQVSLALIGTETEIPIDPWEKLADHVNWNTHHYGSAAKTVRRLPSEELPDRWQGLPVWMTLVLAPSGQAELSEAQRQAIAAWALRGGRLVVTTPGQMAAWTGLGLRPILAQGEDLHTNDPLREHLNGTRDSGQQPGRSEPLPGTGEVATTGFLILALAFALIAGPLNLIWVRRANARHRLLISTPLLSLGTCLALIIADLALQGFSLRRQVHQLVLLDQTTNRAAVWTRTSCYAGYSIASLNVDPESEVIRTGEARDNQYHYSYRRGRNTTNWSIDWREGQHISGTLVPARTNITLETRSVIPERRRVELRQSGTELHLLNGLDVGITAARVLAPDGRVWSCDAVAAGSTTIMQEQADPSLLPGNMASEINTFDSDTRRAIATAIRQTWCVHAVLTANLHAIGEPNGADETPPRALLVARLTGPEAKP